jgi:hypothetical protein
VALITAAGATASAQGKSLTVAGDYVAILNASLDDADKIYHNDGAAIKAKYPVYESKDDRQATYDWNKILSGFDKELKKQEAFAQAKVAFNINAKVVETAYNYYKVVPEKIMDKIGIVIFSWPSMSSTPCGTASPSSSFSKDGAQDQRPLILMAPG